MRRRWSALAAVDARMNKAGLSLAAWPPPPTPYRSTGMSNVFIAFQKKDSRAIVNAILADNPNAIVSDQPAMVKIDVPATWWCAKPPSKKSWGREFDLQEMQVHLITMSGNVDETDDEFTSPGTNNPHATVTPLDDARRQTPWT